MDTNKPISKYSSTMIGLTSGDEQFYHLRDQFKQEAQIISEYVGNIHHKRKIPSMQVNYPHTVEKLHHMQLRSSLYHDTTSNKISNTGTGKDTYARSTNHFKDIQTHQQFLETMKDTIKNETFINERKRIYNQSIATKSVAKDIIVGKSNIPKHQIFPVKITHDQVLAMTNTRAAKDANVIPPLIQKPKKWLGDQLGWES